MNRLSYLFCCFIFYANILEIHTSYWDSVPIVSQTKSFIHYLQGDSEEARTTQDNFLRKSFFPIVPIIQSSIKAIKGDTEGARDTWRQYGQNWEQMAESLPVVGHVKGGIHYVIGETERAHQIMKSSTRPLGAIAGGIGGAVVGGPVGAVAGGIAGGAAMDGIITGIESAARKKYTPHGHVHSVTKIVERKATPDDYVFAGITVVGDGLSGFAAGKPFVKPASTSVTRHSPFPPCRKKRGIFIPHRTCPLSFGLNAPFPPSPKGPSTLPLPRSASKSSISDLPPKSSGVYRFKSPAASVLVNPSIVFPSLGKTSSGLPVELSVNSAPSPNFKRNNPEKNKPDVKRKKKTEKCEHQPEIANRDRNQMVNCEGTKVGQFCRVKCLKVFKPTEERVHFHRYKSEMELRKYFMLIAL